MSSLDKYKKKNYKSIRASLGFSSIDTNQTLDKFSLNKTNIYINKKVAFNGVEIIDVESYKKYNMKGNLILEKDENNNLNDCKSCNCNIF